MREMTVRILKGDCREVLRTLPDESVHCVVTSPPYWGLRDYGFEGQIGLETDFGDYVAEMVDVFRETRRVLRADGTLWLNLGDSYAGSGRGGNPTEETSGLEGSQTSQRASMIRRARGDSEVASTARDAAVTNRFRHAYKAAPAGLKQKDLMGMPWRVAFALQEDGWYLRQDIIWSKPNSMPESVTDRCTKAHEYVFLLAKSDRYFYDASAIAEPAVKAGQVLHSYGTGAKDRQDVSETNDRRTRIGLANWNQACPDTRNRRSVWEITTKPFAEAHFATFPPELAELCIKAGCASGGTILDPFGGAGTTGMVADRLGRNAILIELNPEYAAMAERRLHRDAGMFADVALTSAEETKP